MTFNPLVLTDARIYYDAADLTGFSNKVQMGAKPAVLKRTRFSSQGWQEKGGGVFDGDFTCDTWYQAGDLSMPDDSFWSNLGVATVPVTALPTGGAVGDLAYLTRCLQTAYTPGGSHGEDLMTTVDAETSWPIARGKILHPQGTARTTSGTGTAVQLIAASAGQALYVALHVMSVAGTTPSLTVVVQADNAVGFPSPVTVGTFNAATGLGSQSMRVVGPITDDWYRITWTISGTTPSFLFAVSAGIAAK